MSSEQFDLASELGDGETLAEMLERVDRMVDDYYAGDELERCWAEVKRRATRGDDREPDSAVAVSEIRQPHQEGCPGPIPAPRAAPEASNRTRVIVVTLVVVAVAAAGLAIPRTMVLGEKASSGKPTALDIQPNLRTSLPVPAAAPGGGKVASRATVAVSPAAIPTDRSSNRGRAGTAAPAEEAHPETYGAWVAPPKARSTPPGPPRAVFSTPIAPSSSLSPMAEPPDRTLPRRLRPDEDWKMSPGSVIDLAEWRAGTDASSRDLWIQKSGRLVLAARPGVRVIAGDAPISADDCLAAFDTTESPGTGPTPLTTDWYYCVLADAQKQADRRRLAILTVTEMAGDHVTFRASLWETAEASKPDKP